MAYSLLFVPVTRDSRREGGQKERENEGTKERERKLQQLSRFVMRVVWFTVCSPSAIFFFVVCLCVFVPSVSGKHVITRRGSPWMKAESLFFPRFFFCIVKNSFREIALIFPLPPPLYDWSVNIKILLKSWFFWSQCRNRPAGQLETTE